jgi:PD-(D/E)XK endonuclease
MAMREWDQFKTLKQMGEWAELQFMASAAQRGFTVCRPWGESAAYDVGVDHGPNFLRTQVKSTTNQVGRGYWCDFTRHYRKEAYTLAEVDMFAAYVIPENVWYVIPAAVLIRDGKKGAMLCPVVQPVKRNTFRYERFREAWWLLTKSRRGLGKVEWDVGGFR